MNIDEARKSLDSVIDKSRVHLYKPIQIAEILNRDRTGSESKLNLKKLETYRTKSKKWRDIVCMQFLERVSTSSAKFQDNLFEDNAINPATLAELGKENRKRNGIVEAYIYKSFGDKHLQLESALNYCLASAKETFLLNEFLDQFWSQPGLKRSLDKVFEIVVYALFESVIRAIDIKVDIYYEDKNKLIIDEFSVFAEKVLNLSVSDSRKTLDAHFYRVGVTNAADRGLDMFANFGSIVQVKHLSLDVAMAENIVTSIAAHKIVIVCKCAEERVIDSLLTQIGWRDRIQSIITVEELGEWYEKALRGKYSDTIGDVVLSELSKEIKNEFPSVGNNDFHDFQKERGYLDLKSNYWGIA